jgi:hypothetical protein
VVIDVALFDEVPPDAITLLHRGRLPLETVKKGLLTKGAVSNF